MVWRPWKRAAELEKHCWAIEKVNSRLESELDQVRADYERLRQDYNTVVLMLGNQAIRPAGKTIFDDDPFREVPGDDTYLSPDSGSLPDVRQLEEDLDDAAA